MGYFNYQCGPWVRYIGNSKDEVKSAIDFCFKTHPVIKSLGFPMPKDEEISFLDKIVLECWMPLCAKDQYIKMDILPDFSLDVNANVYHFILN